MNEPKRSFSEKIERIRSDSVHGASFLALEALKAFRELARSGVPITMLRSAALSIAKSRPMMAALFRIGNELLLFMEREGDAKEAAYYCDEIAKRIELASEAASRLAADYITERGTILTHSYSSAVERSLKSALPVGAAIHLFCTESRPANEGRRLADSICKAGIDTTLVVDAAAPYLCKRADLVLFGADGIGSFGLVHKIGTFAISMAAKEYGVEVAVVAESMKFWPSGVKEPKEPPKSAEELIEGECFGALNLYFDTTPLRYIDVVITERGILSPEEAAKLSETLPLHPMLAVE